MIPASPHWYREWRGSKANLATQIQQASQRFRQRVMHSTCSNIPSPKSFKDGRFHGILLENIRQ
jgi:hypothetical protein